MAETLAATMPTSAAYVGIGTNLGERMSAVRGALARLATLAIGSLRTSAVYETRALGPRQPMYLNAVAWFRTDLDPLELLRELQRIETDLGRVRAERWGPRVIDLDLLLVVTDGASQRVVTPGLTVPHPQILHRDFVLAPLCDLEPMLELAPGVTAASGLSALTVSQRTILRRFAVGLVS